MNTLETQHHAARKTIICSESAIKAFGESSLIHFVSRHLNQDWGDITEEEWSINQQLHHYGQPVFSVFAELDKPKCFVISQAHQDIMVLSSVDVA